MQRAGCVPRQPPVLLVAPRPGHFATLLSETARTPLQDHDVYITDWHNARDVELREGLFAPDDCTHHMVRFLESIGPGALVVSVWQPGMAALAATSVMAEHDNPAQPDSPTLMAGVVDCRVNPTGVHTPYDLARGAPSCRDHSVDPSAMHRTALMSIQGVSDDIRALGQTVAAPDLCPHARRCGKTRQIQTGVGHYGVFSGKKWNQQIYPRVRVHIHASAG